MKNIQQKGSISPVLMTIIVLLVIAGGIYLYSQQTSRTPIGQPITVTPLAVTQVENATSTASTTKSSLAVTLGNISYGLKQPQTKLTGGYFIGKFDNCGGASCNGVTYYSHMQLDDKVAEGDLNGDGVKDAAVIIHSGTTASASNENVKYTTHVIAAVINQNGVYKNVAAIELTDDLHAKTTTIKNVEIKDGLIYVTVLKNEGSVSLAYPASTETIQLKLDPSSSDGFKILKDGSSEADSYIEPEITNVTVSGSGANKVMAITGKDFSLLKNTVILTSQGTSTQNYKSVQLESDKNNSHIAVTLSTVSFPGIGGNADTLPFDIRSIPSGKYDVTIDAYRCIAKEVCRDVLSSPFSVTLR